ncbi:YncE family protein [Pseudomonas yamanorum]|uniref:YncE family protein n=2 Tax=Pseudomonas yamanorum TaxID=515393 RepID=A0A7Y8EL32_9PSED|nr:YncE family protein [Pseudomonas yamanorum]NWE16675.1 YncE family protein [Pseudomonas yamanorum]
MTQDLDTPHDDSVPSLPLLPSDTTVEPAPLRPGGFTLPQPPDSVLTAQSFSNEPFSNLPLYIPTLTTPVVGYSGGLNRAALNVSPAGVLFILLPYLDQADGDFIELQLNGFRVAFHTVTADEALNGTQIVLYVESSRFIREAGNTVQAFITRISGGTDQTQLFNIYVDDVLPGGRNPVASTSENENLPKPLFPQNIIDFGVSQDDANRGVPVTIGYYPVDTSLPAVNHRKTRDVIRLSIGGVIIQHTVTEFEAAGRDPIIITVYAGTWAEVGSGVRVCEYDVVDEVGNRSDGFSPAQLLTVRIGTGTEPLLPAPYVLESVDLPDGTQLLDADALNGENATLVVDVAGQGYVLGDVIRATVVGLTVDGVRVTYTYDHPITSTTRVQYIDWPNADVLSLVNGRLLLTYQRIRTGVPARDSEGSLVNIIGTPVDTSLAAPQVPDAVGGSLPPTTNPVFVVIPSYTGQNSNDRITLVLEGTYANGRSYYAEYSTRAGSGDILFDLANGPDGEIAQLEGGSLRLYYTVNDSRDRPPSRTLSLTIGAIRAILRPPTTREAVPPDYVFDPEINRGNLNVTVPASPAFTLGATVFLHADGSSPGGSAPPDAFPIDVNWVGAALPFTVPRGFVTANLNGSLTLYYTVVRPGQPTLTSEALVIRVGSALNLPVPEVLEGTVINPTLTRLNPLHVLPPRPEVVTIRVRYAPMLPTDDIKVHIIGKPDVGTPDIPAKPGIPNSGSDFVDFTVSSAFVAAYLGESCQVYYEVIRGGASTQSKTLTLEVEALASQEWDLVSIPEATGGVIDTSGAYTVRIDAWPFMVAGQLLTVFLRGTTDILLFSRPVTAAEVTAGRVTAPIPADYLRTLAADSTLRVEANVSLDGSGNQATAQAFEVVRYDVRRSAGIVETITVGNTPSILALSPNNQKLYVANNTSNMIHVIDTGTNTVVHIITMPVRATAMVVSSDSSLLYVGTLSSPYKIFEVETTFYTIKRESYNGYYGSALSLNSNGSRLYASYNAGNYVLSIDTVTLNEVSPRFIFNATNRYVNDNLISRDGTRMYVSNTYGVAIYASNGVLIKDLETTPPFGLTKLALTPNTARLYSTSNASIVIIDTTTNDVAKILTNISPTNLAINANTAIYRAFVTESTANSVRIIDTQTEEPMGSIPGFDHPTAIVCNPHNNTLYVANNGTNTIAVVST